MRELRIPVPGGVVSASLHGEGGTVVVLGHGAGSTRTQPAMVALAEALAASGRRCLLYNFLYSEAGRGRPDPAPALEAVTRAIGAYAQDTLGPARLVHGGRSMGGRMASRIVAEGAPADALVLLAYPLHPPGREDQLRDAHLPNIAVPILFVQGTRDDFARPDLLDAVMSRLGERATLHRIEGGDHSFNVPKRTGRTAADVRHEVHRVVVDWLAARGL
jgi:predicted alpha/beta-hydrolase family hydrolase